MLTVSFFIFPVVTSHNLNDFWFVGGGREDKMYFFLKALLHCAIFSASCLTMALRDKLLENCTVQHGLSRNLFVARSVAKVELSSTLRNGLQQLTTPLHSVSPLQQLFSHFYGSFNKSACAHFLFFVPRSIARQVAEKIAQRNRASNLGNLQR